MSIITGWRAIAQTFRVTQAVAKDWREEGAPILLLPGGKKETVPAVHIPELWAWLSGRYGPKAQGLASAPTSRPADGKPSSLPGSPPVGAEPPHAHAATPPQTCPSCGTTGMVRRYRDRWRCEWCRASCPLRLTGIWTGSKACKRHSGYPPALLLSRTFAPVRNFAGNPNFSLSPPATRRNDRTFPRRRPNFGCGQPTTFAWNTA